MAVQMARSGLDWWWAVLLALVSGAVIGLFTGILVSVVRIPSFVVTLALFLGWQGVTLRIIGQGGTVPVRDNTIVGLTNDSMSVIWGWILALVVIVLFAALSLNRWRVQRSRGLASQPLAIVVGRIVLIAVITLAVTAILNVNRALNPNITLAGVPYAVPLVIVLLLVLTFVLTRTSFGRHVYAVGGNADHLPPAPADGTGGRAGRHGNPTLVVLFLSLGGLSFAVLQSLVAPALPTIGKDLHASTGAMSWVLTAYLLSAVGAHPDPRPARRHGRQAPGPASSSCVLLVGHRARGARTEPRRADRRPGAAGRGRRGHAAVDRHRARRAAPREGQRHDRPALRDLRHRCRSSASSPRARSSSTCPGTGCSGCRPVLVVISAARRVLRHAGVPGARTRSARHGRHRRARASSLVSLLLAISEGETWGWGDGRPSACSSSAPSRSSPSCSSSCRVASR